MVVDIYNNNNRLLESLAWLSYISMQNDLAVSSPAKRPNSFIFIFFFFNPKRNECKVCGAWRKKYAKMLAMQCEFYWQKFVSSLMTEYLYILYCSLTTATATRR